jgi:archaellum component FlaC
MKFQDYLNNCKKMNEDNSAQIKTIDSQIEMLKKQLENMKKQQEGVNKKFTSSARANSSKSF